MKEEILIPAKIIRGAMICQAENDVRQYLNGVAFNGETGEVSSSDGRMLFYCYVSVLKGAFDGVRVLKVPQEVPSSICSVIYDVTTDELSLFGKNVAAGVVFRCDRIDGDFPNIKETIQQVSDQADCAKIGLNPVLFKRAINALEADDWQGHLWHAKEGAVLIKVPDEHQRQVVIMKMNIDEYYAS